jgi:AcrR family transcriptional regulator
MISLVFTASDTWLGAAIRYVTNSSVSHVMIEYPSLLWGGKWIAEAHLTGVRKVPAELRRRNVVTEYEFALDVGPHLRVIRHLFGERYDFMNIVWLGYMVLAWRWFKRKLRHPMVNAQAQTCSELVARLLKDAAYPGTEDWEVEEATPELLRSYCASHPELFRACHRDN